MVQDTRLQRHTFHAALVLAQLLAVGGVSAQTANASGWAIAPDVSAETRVGIGVCLRSEGGRTTAVAVPPPAWADCRDLVVFNETNRSVALTFPGIVPARSFNCRGLQFGGSHPCNSRFTAEPRDRPGHREVDVGALDAALAESQAARLVDEAIAAAAARRVTPAAAAPQAPSVQAPPPAQAAPGVPTGSATAPTRPPVAPAPAPAPAPAQAQATAVGQSPRPDKGRVSYQGTYAGQQVGQRGMAEELVGALNLEVIFDGPSVIAVYRPTGLLRQEQLSGLVEGDTCRLFSRSGLTMEGPCTGSGFSGVIRSTRARQSLEVTFDTTAKKVEDAAERARQNAAAAEQAKQAAIAARQLPEPDMTLLAGPARAVRKLVLKMSQIDDSGYAIVIDAAGKWHGVAGVEWFQGEPGASTDDLTAAFTTGRNILVLGLHNKAFMFGAGRWSYAFTLLGDGATLWSGSGGAPGGGVGTRYWKAFSVEKASNGMLTVGAARAEQVIAVTPRMKAFNEDVIKNFGTETSSQAMVLQGVTRSLTDSLNRPPKQKTDDDVAYEQWARRQENAMEWASKKEGRRPEDYQGN